MVAPAGLSSYEIGDIRLTLLPDGYHRCDPVQTFVGSSEADWAEHAHLLDERGRIVMTMGALLVEFPDGTRALLDTGFGNRTIVLADMGLEFWGGRLLKSLTAAGLAADDIDVVAFSHMHIDHVGWTATDAAALSFAKARHVLAREEWDHWAAQPDAGGPGAREIDALRPRVELVDGETSIVPGLRMVPTFGHTPGHCSFLVESGPGRAVVLGDAVHCPLQISHPEWAFSADVNPDQARLTREHLVRELEAPNTTVVGPHFPGAVFGRVLPGTKPVQVAFDVAPAAPPQIVAGEAPAGEIFLPPLD